MNRTLAVALAVLGALTLAAPAHASRASDALKRELGPGVRVAAHDETGQVRFVGAAARPIDTGAASSRREAARAFLARHGDAFGAADPGDLEVTSVHGSSVRFQQRADGIPVVGGELVVNLDAGRDVISASGELLPGSVDRTPLVTAAGARQEAIAAVAKEHQVSAVRLTATTPRLWIYDARLLGGPGPQRPTLVWRLDVKGDSGLAIDDLVLIDAARGHMALRIPQIEEALDREVCDANGTALVTCTPALSARSEGEGPSGIAEVDFAYDYSGDTYDFFFDRFGRDSLDDNGMTLLNTVRHCPSPTDCPFDNAFWNGSQMVYGDGWAAGDDLVGHELTHGVTDFSAHLFYYYQSGAINESLSDVFGEFVDLTNGTGTDTVAARWQVFEDVVGGPFRDMENPGSVLQGGLPSPDRMASPNYFAEEGDNGGVHFNSGVNNKAAFLITDGGSFNARTVTGIGLDKAARIYYDVQTTLLTSGSDYADLGTALPAACDSLIGTLGITEANCTEVRDAVAAVEMSTDPPLAPAPHAPAATCPSGQVRTDLFEDDMEAASNPNWLTSGTVPWQFTDAYAHSGTISLFGPDTVARGENILTMANSVELPEGATSFLRFDHSFGFEDNSAGTAFDGGVLEISVNGGAFTDIGSLLTDVGYNGAITTGSDNPLEGRQAFVGESHGYRASRATLTPRAGDSVRFRFRIATDTGVSGAGWFLDDVRIYACAPPPAPPDGDGDGVPDASDACPTVAASTANGCPATPGPTSPTGPGGPGGPVPTNPTGPGGGDPATTLASARVRSCKLAGRGRGRKARLRCTLRGFGAVRRATVTVKKGRKTVARKTVRPSAAGVLSFRPSRALRRGTYKVTLVLRDAAGTTRTLKKTLRVR
jgi:bacillolysin